MLSLVPEANVVDISHSVPRDDIYAAAFMMLDAYPYFPEGSVHIIGVNDIASSVESPHIVVKADNHFFIGADNGFFTLLHILSEKKAQAVHRIEVEPETAVNTFPSRDLFPHVAALLLNGTPLDAIGSPTTLQTAMLEKGIFLQATPEKDRDGQIVGSVLSGKVLYVDHFGNIITNITLEKYSDCIRNYPFSGMQLGWKSVSGRFVKAYKDVPEGDIAFIFLSNGLLEISINRAHAGNLLGVDRNAKVFLRFGQAKK